MRQVRSDRRLLFRSLVLAVTTVQRGMARLNLSTCMPRKKLSSPHWHGSHHSFTVCKNAAAATSNTVKCKLRFSLHTCTLYFPANFTKLAMCFLRFNWAFLLPSGLVNSRYDDIFFPSFPVCLSVSFFSGPLTCCSIQKQLPPSAAETMTPSPAMRTTEQSVRCCSAASK